MMMMVWREKNQFEQRGGLFYIFSMSMVAKTALRFKKKVGKETKNKKKGKRKNVKSRTLPKKKEKNSHQQS
jgi:hypothetical protein